MTQQDLHTSRPVAAVLLAAGRSQRMGRPKQLLPLGDEGTLVETAARRVRPHVDELVVVVGHVGGQVAALLAPLGARVVVNEQVERGMLSSVQVGLRGAPDAAGYLICLGDQPGVTADAIRRVLDAAAAPSAAGPGAGIVIPTTAGRRGHPVYLHRRFRDEILALDPETTGLNAVTRAHPEQTVEVAVDDEGILIDVDTPADYERARRRHAGTAR